MSDNIKDMILADAIETAIENEKIIIKQKRKMWILFIVNCVLVAYVWWRNER